MSYQIVGSREIAEVAREVRRLGSGRVIVNNMAKEIRLAGKPLTKLMKASVLAKFPKRGGLNRWAARSGFRVSVKRGARSAGVNVVVGRNSSRKRSDLRDMNDQGRTRSPLYGNRKHWYPHRVPTEAFTQPVETKGVQDFRDAITDAVNKAAREVGL